MRKLFHIVPLLLSISLNAKALTLTTESEIQRAQEMSRAIDTISQRVMACFESPGGSREACVCSNLAKCKFKSDLEKASSLYCKIKMDYPEWLNKPINYYSPDDKVSNALGMEGLELQFGKYCK